MQVKLLFAAAAFSALANASPTSSPSPTPTPASNEGALRKPPRLPTTRRLSSGTTMAFVTWGTTTKGKERGPSDEDAWPFQREGPNFCGGGDVSLYYKGSENTVFLKKGSVYFSNGQGNYIIQVGLKPTKVKVAGNIKSIEQGWA
ncbi:hypothetical protein NUU61_004588 [Penicillium alfredii]|uniref:Pectate lyase n=1 Tax=Penicillium alfredii TaxID=1506179 RepID=A0A9W9FLE1_9EURO|nr:uncharacterized protein NUU61_004588 [Penicillium alfredii]KAJ5102366.1 hypothetical protein NUU61_004588 [Penicillium alfredii]